jgi:hypothetical protein
MLAPYIESNGDTPLLALSVRSLDLYDDFVARVTSESAVTVAYRRTGTLDVATDETEMRELRAMADVLSRQHVHAEILDAPAVRLEAVIREYALGGGVVRAVDGVTLALERGAFVAVSLAHNS